MSAEPAGHDILVVGPSWVGDMVMSQTLYKVLKKAQPASNIDVLAPAWSEPLLAAMPEVRTGINMPVGHGEFGLQARRRLARQLKSHAYKQAFVLPNSWKSALIPWLASIPKRTGWRGEMRAGLLNDMRKLDKQQLPYMVQRYVALAAPVVAAPVPLQDIERPALVVADIARETVKNKLSIAVDRPLLALCPGAEFGPAKRWPEQHFAMVAIERIRQGERVLLFGSMKDRPVTEAIQALLPSDTREYCMNLAGETSLCEALHALALCTRVVSNDSGLMHIAAALGKTVVAVYGSTSPSYTPPLGEYVQAVSLDVDCGPCFQRQCPIENMKCLTQLKPERVLDELAAMQS